MPRVSKHVDGPRRLRITPESINSKHNINHISTFYFVRFLGCSRLLDFPVSEEQRLNLFNFPLYYGSNTSRQVGAPALLLIEITHSHALLVCQALSSCRSIIRTQSTQIVKNRLIQRSIRLTLSVAILRQLFTEKFQFLV